MTLLVTNAIKGSVSPAQPSTICRNPVVRSTRSLGPETPAANSEDWPSNRTNVAGQFVTWPIQNVRRQIRRVTGQTNYFVLASKNHSPGHAGHRYQRLMSYPSQPFVRVHLAKLPSFELAHGYPRILNCWDLGACE